MSYRLLGVGCVLLVVSCGFCAICCNAWLVSCGLRKVMGLTRYFKGTGC